MQSTANQEWEHIIADCRRIEAARTSANHEDNARVACRYVLTIPAQSEAVVWARLPARLYGPDNWVMVELPEPLPLCTGAVCL